MRVSSRALPIAAAIVSTLLLTACGGGGTAGGAGAAATTMSQSAAVIPQVVAISPTERMMFVPASPSGDAAPAGTPPIVNAWVSLSSAISGLPCANCAGNPPISGSLGIAFPEPYLPAKGSYELTYTFYNVSEGKSSCSLIFNFLQGATSLLHSTSTIKLNGDGQYVYFIGGALPSNAVAGTGTVNADVHCNKFIPKAASQQIILH
ncbi:MAG: hypothetical protein M3R51_06790 [Candidatus Eremiobacteraeota bacterium]|nr:hypothetical protein [Candidatus Eremiobacteraeota bacterium]